MRPVTLKLHCDRSSSLCGAARHVLMRLLIAFSVIGMALALDLARCDPRLATCKEGHLGKEAERDPLLQARVKWNIQVPSWHHCSD
eukprot:6481357-Amphidinium_carterae.3